MKVGLVPWSFELGLVFEPSTDPTVILSAITALDAHGQATRSFVGLEAARELLSEEPEGIHRARVLLTDGEDNRDERGERRLGRWPQCREPRRAQCEGAKAEGAKLFVVAAMPPREMTQSLGRELRR